MSMEITWQSIQNVWDEYVAGPLAATVTAEPWQAIAAPLAQLRDRFVDAGSAIWDGVEKTRVANPLPMSDTEGRITHLAIVAGGFLSVDAAASHLHLLAARERAGHPFDHVTILVSAAFTERIFRVMLEVLGVDLSRITFIQYPKDATPYKMCPWIQDPILAYTQGDRTLLRGVPNFLDERDRTPNALTPKHLAHQLCTTYDTITCEGLAIDTAGGNLLVTAGIIFIGTGTETDVLSGARLRWDHGTRYRVVTLGTAQEPPANGHIDMYMHPTGMHTDDGKPIVVISDPHTLNSRFNHRLQRDIEFLQGAGFHLHIVPTAISREAASEMAILPLDTYTNVLFEHYFVQGEERCLVTVPQYDRFPFDLYARYVYQGLGCTVIPVNGMQHVSPMEGSLRCITKVLARGPLHE